MIYWNSLKNEAFSKNIKIAGGFAAVFILISIFTFIFYGKILLSPNSYLFNANGDAIKNYYVFDYYIDKNDFSSNFMGFNYPYGENILFTDNNPALSSGIKTISKILPVIKNYNIGILNYSMILSFTLCALFIYLILTEFDINIFLAILASISITVLSPQVFRLGGHFSLSYSFFIPISWYLYIKFEKSIHKTKYSILLLINNLFWFFIHAYLGMILTVFLFLYAIIKFFIEYKTIINKIKYLILSFVQIVIPVLIFKVFASFSDSHTGRTDNPWGFFEYNSDFQSVFLPNHPPLRTIYDYFIRNIQQKWEGLAYIGLIAEIVILFYFIIFIINIFKNKTLKLSSNWFINNHLKIAFISSLIILLFSMGLPFRNSLQYLLNYFPVIKQFRSTGRFAWIFFFVINIISVCAVNKIARAVFSKRALLSYLFFFIITAFTFSEGLPYHEEISKEITVSPNIFNINQLSEAVRGGLKKIPENKYQAIIPLPYFCGGSENFYKAGTEKIYKLAFTFSFHTGLPVFGNSSARSSIWESKNIMQVMSPCYYNKAIVKDINSKKPFLLILSNEPLSNYEQMVLAKGNLFYECKDYRLLEITKEKLFSNTASEEISEFNLIKNNLFDKNGFLTSDSTGFILYNDFESEKCDLSFRGQGALCCNLKYYNIITELNGSSLKQGSSYIASFWMYNNGENFGQDLMNSLVIIEEVDHGHVEWTSIVNPGNSFVINDDWTLVEAGFQINHPVDNLRILLKGNDWSDKMAHVDDILVYQAGTIIYKIEKEENGKIINLFKNNQEIEIPITSMNKSSHEENE